LKAFLADLSIKNHAKLIKEFTDGMKGQKSNFLANMNHKIRTPFMGMFGASRFLLENLNDDQVK
jgi:signal transduction histidine kinase